MGAVHNSARTVKSQNGEVRSIAHGIRSDSVLELLVYHKLDRDVPFPIDKSKVALDRWTKPDERGDEARVLYAKATALVNESKYLWTKKEYQEAKEKCDAALKLVPNHADAYYNRANAIHSIYVDNYRMPKEQALQLLKLAYTDAIKCGQLHPSDPLSVFLTCHVLNGFALASGNETIYDKTLAVVNELLGSDNLLNRQRAEGFSTRAEIYLLTSKNQAALRDFNESIRLDPECAFRYENRGDLLERDGPK